MKAPVGKVVPDKFMVDKSKIPKMRVTGITGVGGRGSGRIMKEIMSACFGKKRLQVEGTPRERGGLFKKGKKN